MGILKKAVNEQAFLKAGMLGFPGSGKTYTAATLAIGLSKKIGDNKPIAFFDTETGSDFLVSRFNAEGIELLRVKSHAFKDLLEAAREAEKTCSVLIVDSISHVWKELCETYKRNRKLTRLSFQHWGDIKKEWSQWTNFYLNSRLHIFVLGRAGYEYDFEKDEEGRNELIKVGTKMKVESEFGFEPSLLIEMERVAKGSEPGSGWIHRAHILKDRTDTINGKAFDFQKPSKAYKAGDWKGVYAPFAPVFEALNVGGEHHGVDSDRNSDGLFTDGNTTRAHNERLKTIRLEEIQAIMTAMWPGQDAASKKAKAEVVHRLFNTRSWTAVESLPLDKLESALKILETLENTIKEGEVDSLDDVIKLIATTQEKVTAAQIAAASDDVPQFEGKTVGVYD